MKQLHIYFLTSFLFAGLLTISGCSKPGGGASAKVQVQPKASNLALLNAEEDGGSTGGGNNDTGKKKSPGTLTGQIIVEGGVKKLPLLVVKGSAVKDAAVCSAGDIPDEKLIVNQNGGVANVYIYLAKAPKNATIPAAPKRVVEFNNVGCRFVPHTLLARTGQTILIKNKDTVAHNTHTYPVRNSQFNSAVSAKGTPLVYEEKEKIPVSVKCDFHAWMKAWHLPLNHPYAAITDKDGKFTIKNLPPGKHKFTIWHETSGMLDGGYVVVIDGSKDVKINFNASQFVTFAGPQPKTIRITALP